MRVVVDVGFGNGRDITQGKGNRPSIPLLYQWGNARLQAISHGDVGQRTDWRKDHLMRIRHDSVDNKLGSVA